MEKIQRNPIALQGASPQRPTASRKKRQSERQFLPQPAPDVLEPVYRDLDDLPPTERVSDHPSEITAQIGYKFSTGGCASPIRIPRRKIVIAVRNIAGRVVALHSIGQWFTARQIHFANFARSRWTGEVEVYADTITADVESLRRNVACVALNGLTHHDLQLATSHLNVKLVRSQTWKDAA